MQVLESRNTESEAEQAFHFTRELLKKESQNKRCIQVLAHTFGHLNPIRTILKAMIQWKDSFQFVSLATDVLKISRFYVPTSRSSFLQLGGCHILIEACEEHWFLPMVEAALAALSNMASFLTRDAVVIEVCLSFVDKIIRIFDADVETQRLGTYFCLKLAASAAMNQQSYEVRMEEGTPDNISSCSSSARHVSKRKLQP
ncbi:MAG: hypothetical protein SGBAC_011553 [Bacillariaceae sp.]